MGRNKRYSGYSAYDYLEPGKDYKKFQLRQAIVLEWEYKVPLSKTEEDRFQEILEKNIIVDLHEHPCLYPKDLDDSPRLTSHGKQFMAYEALSHSGIDCVFDNLLDGRCNINTKHGWDWMSTLHDLGQRLCDISHQDFVIHCKSTRDIHEAFDKGKLAWVAALESASCVENEVDRIDVLFGLGVRSLGICYSENNMLGGGMGELSQDAGLSDFGYDCLVRMNKLGMLIDVGHTSDRTALEVIEYSKDPIYNSHSGPGAIAQGHTSGDEVLKALAESDGLMAIGGAGRGLRTKKHPIGSIDSYGECMEYCIEVMGIDHVACGPDSLYGDHQEHYEAFAKWSESAGLGKYNKPGKKETEERFPVPENMSDPGYVKGLENPNEFVNIARWMIKNGYTDEEISKVMGKNALRLLEKVWPK
jgi:membrane dipeptidase